MSQSQPQSIPLDVISERLSDLPKQPSAYNAEFDAYFNPVTLEWLEAACGDEECNYCANRPEKAPKPNVEQS